MAVSGEIGAAYAEARRPRFLTAGDVELLLQGGRAAALMQEMGEDDIDLPAVVKLVGAHGLHVWLLSELDTKRPWIAYGLADLGFDCVEYGSVDLEELAAFEEANVRRDDEFAAGEPLSAYAERARLLPRAAR